MKNEMKNNSYHIDYEITPEMEARFDQTVREVFWILN